MIPRRPRDDPKWWLLLMKYNDFLVLFCCFWFRLRKHHGSCALIISLALTIPLALSQSLALTHSPARAHALDLTNFTHLLLLTYLLIQSEHNNNDTPAMAEGLVTFAPIIIIHEQKAWEFKSMEHANSWAENITFHKQKSWQVMSRNHINSQAEFTIID